MVREWIERNLGPVGKLEGAVEGAGEIGRFLGQVPSLLTRAGTLLDQLDDITRDGLVLSPETVAAIGQAEARRNRWTAAALWVDRGCCWAGSRGWCCEVSSAASVGRQPPTPPACRCSGSSPPPCRPASAARSARRPMA